MERGNHAKVDSGGSEGKVAVALKENGVVSTSGSLHKRTTSQLTNEATKLLRERVKVTEKLKDAVDEQHAQTLRYMEVLQRDIEDKDLAVRGLEIKLRETEQENETLRFQLDEQGSKMEEL